MNPKISIIVPVYNVEVYLERCVKSLVEQTYTNIEIILVDDFSSDKSGELCDKMAASDSRIKVIHKEKNEGLALARNTGLSYATGAYVQFIDSDDYVETTMCQQLVEQLDGDTDIILFRMDCVSEKSSAIPQHNSVEKLVYCGSEVMNDAFPFVVGSLPEQKKDYTFGMSPCTFILKLDIINANNIKFISERQYLYEDLTFVFQLYPYINKVKIYPEVLYHYWMNESSLTRTYQEDKIHKIKKVDSYIQDKYATMFQDIPTLKLCYQRTMISYVRLCCMQTSNHKQTYASLKKIVKSKDVQSMLEGYPISKLPIKQQLFALGIRNGWSIWVYVLLLLYNIKK